MVHRTTIKEHCWHSDLNVLLTHPLQHRQTCCWCGAKRMQKHRLSSEGHGEYLPASIIEVFHTEPDRECIDRQLEQKVTVSNQLAESDEWNEWGEEKEDES